MTRRTYLPYDVARCDGKEVDGTAVIPCNNCARREFRNQVHEFRQPWLMDRHPVMGHCPEFIDVDYGELK
jgi:hypothetical protein